MLNHKLLIPTMLLSMACCSLSANAELSIHIDAGVRSDDNIGLAPVGGDKIDDLTTQISAKVNWAVIQTAVAEFNLSGGLYLDSVSDLSDLSRDGFTLGASYRAQATPELTALFWILDGEYRLLRYNDSEIREGYDYKVNATLGKRLNQRITLLGGYRYEGRNSTKSRPAGRFPLGNAQRIFDQVKDGFFIRTELDVTANTVFFAEYSRMKGDVAATGRSFNAGGRFDRAADLAFGPGFILWKIDATQNIYDVGISHQFHERFGLELTYSILDASGAANNDYENQVLTAIASLRF